MANSIKGVDGNIKIGGSAVAHLNRFTLNINKVALEDTAYGDTWIKRVSGLRSWDAELGGQLDRSDAEQEAILDQLEDASIADLALDLYVGSSSYWTGSAVITGQTTESAVGDLVSVSISVMGNGAITYTA